MVAPDSQLSAAWARVRGRLRTEIGDVAYRSWLKPLTLTGLAEGEVRLAAPTRFMRDWILSHYHDRLTRLWVGEIDSVREVTVTVEQARSATKPVTMGRNEAVMPALKAGEQRLAGAGGR